MYETGKLAQVTAEMRRYNLHILGVSESRWTGSGRVQTQTGETVLYSGREDNQHHEGVAIILRKGTDKCLIEWKPINSRLISARVRGNMAMTLIQCYAPTNDGDDEVKDTFYDQLQAEVSAAPHHDLLIVMGDMNAKVGNDNTHVERTMGRHGCGCMNENGERLVELCTMYNLVIGGTLFPHRNVHKLTWCSPNGRDRNQIDHLMINGSWRRSLLDVRALADVTDICEADAESINQRWDLVKTVYQKSSETSLGLRGTKKKEWITPETWKAIEERRDLKKKVASTRSERLQEKFKLQYREMNRKVKRSARSDKRAYLNNLASEDEEAARKGEQGKLYKITKTISGKFHSTNNAPVKDKGGKLLNDRERTRNTLG
ncbi:craniofacial development protein 2-like [Pomacea canaliculata]|uniref:craniofacial development protein 2-like n=1 Tax=Pomacea canaliculata TaxID=400727 RepID=UPI000D7288E6|nr:craniofacial development protein 2-like [Pomacea canaliculata]